MKAINSVNTDKHQAMQDVSVFLPYSSSLTASAMAQQVKAKPDPSFNLQNPRGRKNRTHAHKLFSGLCACIKIIKF